jgi:hypothetical protein
MVGISPGWAAELTGEKIDLDDFREALKAPSSIWIEEYTTGMVPLLRSKSWENLSKASHVYQDAERIIERLNGEALLFHDDARPIKLVRVMKFDINGNREGLTVEAEVRIFSQTKHFA